MISPEIHEQLATLQDALPKVAKTYEGTAVLAPSEYDLIKASKLHISQVPKGGEGLAWTFRALTGLEIVHRGLMLGDPAKVGKLDRNSLPEISVDVEDLATRIGALPEQDRQRLLARFTLANSQQP